MGLYHEYFVVRMHFQSDFQLPCDALAQVGQCRSLRHSHGPYGENLFWGSGSDWTGQDAVTMWADEVKYYDYWENSCTSGQMCGHYTQVVARLSIFSQFRTFVLTTSVYLVWSLSKDLYTCLGKVTCEVCINIFPLHVSLGGVELHDGRWVCLRAVLRRLDVHHLQLRPARQLGRWTPLLIESEVSMDSSGSCNQSREGEFDHAMVESLL